MVTLAIRAEILALTGLPLWAFIGYVAVAAPLVAYVLFKEHDAAKITVWGGTAAAIGLFIGFHVWPIDPPDGYAVVMAAGRWVVAMAPGPIVGLAIVGVLLVGARSR